MEIRGDYDRYKNLNIIHSITQLPGHPGQLLLQRIQGISTLKIDVSIVVIPNVLYQFIT